MVFTKTMLAVVVIITIMVFSVAGIDRFMPEKHKIKIVRLSD